MDYNKGEAIKVQKMAEKKLAEKDFVGAKKFTLKAKSLFPTLEGISQLLTTLEVYISSEKKISGEIDWYEVLGVYPSDNDEVIRKQFHKMARILHPDKNKLVGSDGAFKIISEAWSMLSDKTKRSAYDKRRFPPIIRPFSFGKSGDAPPPPKADGFGLFSKRGTSSVLMGSGTTPPYSNIGSFGNVSQKTAKTGLFVGSGLAPPHSYADGSDSFSKISDKSSVFMGSATTPPSQNADYFDFVSIRSGPTPPPLKADSIYKSFKAATLSTKKTKKAKRVTPVRPSSAPHPEPETDSLWSFWSTCDKCKRLYMSRINYVNHTLLCLNCSEPFRAIKTSPSGSLSKSPVSSTHLMNRYPSGRAPSGVNQGKERVSSNYQKAPQAQVNAKKPKKGCGGHGRIELDDETKTFAKSMELDIGSLKAEKARTEVRMKLGEPRH